MSDTSGAYRVEEMFEDSSGHVFWGVRRPDGSWRELMDRPDWHLLRETAERTAAELNRIHGLTPREEVTG